MTKALWLLIVAWIIIPVCSHAQPREKGGKALYTIDSLRGPQRSSSVSKDGKDFGDGILNIWEEAVESFVNIAQNPGRQNILQENIKPVAHLFALAFKEFVSTRGVARFATSIEDLKEFFISYLSLAVDQLHIS